MMRIRWKGLELPTRVVMDSATALPVYGLFIAEPFERGFGVTIGNSLRRILLSSLEGAAVTGIKIDAVLHEFSSIDGVMEDVTDIVLNIKGLVVRLEGSEPRTIVLEARDPGPVTAATAHTSTANGTAHLPLRTVLPSSLLVLLCPSFTATASFPVRPSPPQGTCPPVSGAPPATRKARHARGGNRGAGPSPCLHGLTDCYWLSAAIPFPGYLTLRPAGRTSQTACGG